MPTKTVHAHGCPKCRNRFEDSCTVPKSNPVCVACRTGYLAWPMMREHRLPKDCCRAKSRLASKEEIKHYALGGTCVWYICRVCARTHPFSDPTKEMTRS